MRTTYYGLHLMLLLGVGVAASCWGATLLGARDAYGSIAPALFFFWGTVSLAEGLALGLDWRGSASQFQALKDGGDLSLVDRYLTWEIGPPQIALVTWYRILGWFSVAVGVAAFPLGLHF